MTPRPLSSFLTRLIWLCMAPLLLIAVWLAWDSLREQEAKHQREGANLAKNFATHIDQFLRARINALNLLAVSPLADHPRSWPVLYAEAQGFRESFGAHVIFADTERRMLFNTRTPYGANLPPLPLSKGRSAAPLALATGKPQVGDLVIGPVSRQRLAALAVPGLRDGRVAHLMLTTLDAALLQQRLEQAALPQGWSLALQDSTGADIARRSPVGFNAAQDVEADHRFVVPLRQSAWRVVLEIPRASHRDEQQRSLIILAAAIAFATLAGLFGGALASRRVIRAVRTLSEGEEEQSGSEFSEVTAAWQRLEQTRIAWRGSEARFQQLFDQTPLPLALVAPDGRILTLNARFQAVLGYTPADLPDAAVWFERAYPDPALRARALATWAKASQGGDIGPREYRVTTKSGEARDMVISSVLLPEGALVIFDDVTERRRQESQLRLWAESFVHADFAVAISDARSNTFMAVNPAFARQRGYTPQELIGQPVMSVFPEELRASIRDRLAELVTQPHGVIETEHQTRDGRRFPVLVDMTVIHDDEGRAVNRIAYALDLTDRKRAEAELAAAQAAALAEREQARLAAMNQMEDANVARRQAEAASAALRESQERLQLLIDHAPAALAMFDREMRYLAVSRRWLEDYALGERDILGRSHYEVFPDLPDALKAVHQRGLSGEVVRADEDRFERADGTVQWLRWEMRPWHSVDGGIGGIVIFSEDITRLMIARREIFELNADLERRVAERTAELSAANSELDAFAYAVSHDLRAPLRAMNGFSQALLEDYGNQLEGEAKVYLGQIGIASRKMDELVDGILALSRSTRGELRRDTVDLSALARRRLEELAAAEPGREVSATVEAGMVAQGDARMLEAALTNLIDNAWKYTGQTPRPVIRVYPEQRDGERWFCIADNGAGFNPAHVNRLFKPFQRLHRQDEFPGIGIGLATVARIVHRHGGEIEAQGAVGKGATFRFRLGMDGTIGE
jgi:PAS domain S-box-containing protein